MAEMSHPEDELCEVKRSHKTINIFENDSEAMAPTCKLTYFPLTALAEPIRFLLSYGNIEFEDVRIEKEQWPQHKANMPFGQMPVFEINGKVHHQSMAISRYLAKQNHLAGENDLEALEIDTMVDTINDLRTKIGRYHYEADEKVKASLEGPLKNETIPYYMERLEKIAKTNNGYLALGKLTWADLVFVGFLDYMNWMLKEDLVEKYPNVARVQKNVEAVPQIKAWIAKRPKNNI